MSRAWTSRAARSGACGMCPSDEPRLVKRIVELASDYGRYGYRRVTALLRREGWTVNHKRVERLWRQEGLESAARSSRNGGGCGWPTVPASGCGRAHQDHVWSYDFVADRTSDGRAVRMLTVIDEFTRECLAIDVARRLTSEDVLERLSDLFVRRGVPAYLRSDNGPEFTATKVRDWLASVGVKTLFIEPGSPWENGYVESFNGKLRDELLGPRAVRHVAGGEGAHRAVAAAYNTVRPHSSLGYRAPAPEAIQPASFASATPQQTKEALGHAQL